MNEFELIARLTKSLPTNQNVVAGAGDDCAVLDFGLPDKLLLFKTDAVVEGIHFTKDTPPEKIGHKALARCLSDIAAMAGTPTAALVTLGLPKSSSRNSSSKIYDGMNALAEKHGVAIVGGETTTNPGTHFHFHCAARHGRARESSPALRRESGRRDFCDRRTGRFAGGQTSGIRAAPGRGALAGGTFFHSRDD